MNISIKLFSDVSETFKTRALSRQAIPALHVMILHVNSVACVNIHTTVHKKNTNHRNISSHISSTISSHVEQSYISDYISTLHIMGYHHAVSYYIENKRL